MLKRVRIEVEGPDCPTVLADLDKYEHALQAAEAERYGLGHTEGSTFRNWGVSVNERDFYNDRLGREVSDEVVEFDAGLPGYKGRRVVRYTRLDGRGDLTSVVPPPRVVDHWEDRTSYPDQTD